MYSTGRLNAGGSSRDKSITPQDYLLSTHSTLSRRWSTYLVPFVSRANRAPWAQKAETANAKHTYCIRMKEETVRTPSPIHSPSKKPRDTSLPAVAMTPRHPFKVPFGPNSILAHCNHCDKYAYTKVEHISGDFAWISMFCLTPVLLCCLPCSLDQFKDAEHSCRNCASKIGYYQRPLWNSSSWLVSVIHSFALVISVLIMIILCVFVEEYVIF